MNSSVNNSQWQQQLLLFKGEIDSLLIKRIEINQALCRDCACRKGENVRAHAQVIKAHTDI